jgi:spermidine/putrescine transport system ATP-binding protein
MRLHLDAVSKSYGALQVLAPTTLVVEDGEFLTILGPSGSGKTTVLRLVGGFTRPTSGRVVFADRDLTAVPTHKRPFNTVFQDYALFPHMTVASNVGYGLMIRGTAKGDIRRRVAETLDIVGLGTFLQRYPAQLSGGQKQRVALARAIICEPKLVLLDEPLGALDAELRHQMQLFLKHLQKRIRTTFLFVTHDQEEAITMSDRIVVMNAGRIEQIGTPKDIYYRPRTAFVAGFFGDNNLVAGEVVGGNAVRTRLGVVGGPPGMDPRARPVLLAIRPEKLRLDGTATAGALQLPGRVDDIVFVGAITHVLLRPDAAPDQVMVAKLTSDRDRVDLAIGAPVTATMAPEDVAVVETQG